MPLRDAAPAMVVASALVAWLTLTVPPAARLLQLAILGSMLYVGYLAWRGARGIRAAQRRTTAQILTVAMGPDGGSGYAEAAAVDAGLHPEVTLAVRRDHHVA